MLVSNKFYFLHVELYAWSPYSRIYTHVALIYTHGALIVEFMPL